MTRIRRPGTAGLLVAACFGIPWAAHAACSGPPALSASFRAHPRLESAIKLGSWFADHKQFDCAAATLRAGVKSNPESAQLHYLLGLALEAGKHPREGMTELETSVRLAPDQMEPRLLLATIYEENGKRAEAEEQWKQALRMDPKSEAALEGLAGDLIARQNYAEAVKLLEPAARTEKLAIKLSQALGLLNYLDEAAAVLNQAMQANPDSLPLANAMTVVLVKLRRYQEAVNMFEGVAARHPNDQEAQVEFLRLLVVTNHYTQAAPLGPKLLAARPKDPEVLYLNGVIERNKGNYQEAKTLLEKAVSLDGNFFYSRSNLGMALVQLREWPEAKQQLEKAIALSDTEPELHFELAKALRGLGDSERSGEEMKRYQQMKKDEEAELEANEAASQGDSDLRDGKIKEALGHYHEAVEGQPKSSNYRYKLSIAMERAGDLAGEREQLEEAVKLDPKNAGAQNALGYLLSRGGDVEGSVEHFRLAAAAAPGWTKAWINLAAELAMGAHFPEAREAVNKALELEPDNAQAQKLLDRLSHDPAATLEHP